MKLTDPIVEKRFEYKGYPCVVLFQKMCHRCGYVGIPKGRAVDIMTIECHGGITYRNSQLYGQEDTDRGWIGFDCAHWRDGHDWEAGREYWKDDPETLHYIDRIEELYRDIDFGLYPRSLDYCISECKHIVDQLTAEEFG